jgi:bifunctional UDP-N-acetylglucosamine pyrophosphorylase / glucosamine-1-phosphate N-acetyltransferase
MTDDSLAAVILAAGESKRMKSARSKALHPLCGVPLLVRVLRIVQALDPARVVVVVSPESEELEQLTHAHGALTAVQHERLGTGHATLQAESLLADFDGTLLLTCVDIPLLRPETLRALVERHRSVGTAATLLSAEYDDPTGYGRVVRGEDGGVRAIVEHRDADEATRRIREINSSVYCFDSRPMLDLAKQIRAENAQGEQYLTDVIGLMVARGERVAAMVLEDAAEIAGINNRVQLAEAERVLRGRVRERVMLDGVTLVDPATTYIDEDVSVGRDTTIWPCSFVLGSCTIGSDCTIGPHATIENSDLGDAVRVLHGSFVRGSGIGSEVSVGPFAHVRPDCDIGARSRVGSFVETKRAEIGEGTKAGHFSYLGDVRIGREANIGAGAVTCNYDGKRKHETIIEDGAFIGTNASLVAPVTIGKGAYVAAGSTITQDVPPGALAVGRGKQRNIEGWAKRRGGSAP